MRCTIQFKCLPLYAHIKSSFFTSKKWHWEEEKNGKELQQTHHCKCFWSIFIEVLYFKRLISLVSLLFLGLFVFFILFSTKNKIALFILMTITAFRAPARKVSFVSLHFYERVLQIAIGSTCWDKMKTVQLFKPPNKMNGTKQTNNIPHIKMNEIFRSLRSVYLLADLAFTYNQGWLCKSYKRLVFFMCTYIGVCINANIKWLHTQKIRTSSSTLARTQI